MTENPPGDNNFINQLHTVIKQNMSNEQFGVSELADQMNMSRSNLLRKVKKETELSVTQLISQARLKKAMELLRSSSMNVSEVSNAVGFNSTSYFIKCFREHYGYPPGEAGKRTPLQSEAKMINNIPSLKPGSKRRWIITAVVTFVLILISGAILFYRESLTGGVDRQEKSIAVLPFKNDSSDSTNIYLINGIMESTLNNLSQIQELKVTSRTTAEKYRNTSKSIPEMANELGVTYFIEGSGQKIGNEILLNIQLIDGKTDRHLWSRQYRRQAQDIFALQQEIAKNIAEEIEVIITPDERRQIEKIPTENLQAYDLFLQGREMIYRSGPNDLITGTAYMKKAIALDPDFTLAYANAVIAYYYLDMFQAKQHYEDTIARYSDKALLLDPTLAESMIARGLYYMHRKEYKQAVPYFEKALEKNPGSGLVVHFLTEYYNIHNPNTEKHLKYALMGVEIDKGSTDSLNLSFKYLQVSHALVQSGFFDESMQYIDRSLAYNPNNYFGYIKIFIKYAKTNDMHEAKASLLKYLEKDSMRFDILQQVGAMCYRLEEYEEAFKYFSRFNKIREAQRLDVFDNQNLAIGICYEKMGLKKEAAAYIERFKRFADTDQTIYKNIHLYIYYCYKNDIPKAMEHLRLFAKEDNFQYWVLLLESEPLTKPMRNNPEFKKILKQMQDKFWKTHERMEQEFKI